LIAKAGTVDVLLDKMKADWRVFYGGESIKRTFSLKLSDSAAEMAKAD
jgi:hypothetical protein